LEFKYIGNFPNSPFVLISKDVSWEHCSKTLSIPSHYKKELSFSFSSGSTTKIETVLTWRYEAVPNPQPDISLRAIVLPSAPVAWTTK
jgi:hypothetical protein